HTSTPDTHPLSLHDALPICTSVWPAAARWRRSRVAALPGRARRGTLGRPHHLLQMDHARPRADLVQHAVGARRAAQLGDRARLVLEVAEGDRLRRARLLAGGEDVAVPHAALLVTMRMVLAGDDPLYAHRA